MPPGVVGSSELDHALALTFSACMTKAGALPSGRVMFHGHLQYYGPLGLPLHDTRLRFRLIRAPLPHRLCRRVSPVPHRAFSTSRVPYPGEVQRPADSRTLVSCLRRDMRGSALPYTFRLRIYRGGRLHFMLRAVDSLPPFGGFRRSAQCRVSRPAAGACFRVHRRLPGGDSHPLIAMQSSRTRQDVLANAPLPAGSLSAPDIFFRQHLKRRSSATLPVSGAC